MSGKLLLIHGTITEVRGDEYFAMREQTKVLENLLRESLRWIGDRKWHERIHEALGEPMPALPFTAQSTTEQMQDVFKTSGRGESSVNMTDIQPAEISQLEYACPASVSHLMPAQGEIPEEFKWRNKWTDFCDEWFFKGADPKRLTAKDGIDRVKALRHVATIMGSFEPKHEDRIAASAYLLSLWFDLDGGTT